jgi:PadR family transcriptional regulator PadR
MSRSRPSNPDFLNRIPEMLVLRLLADRPMHGYDLVRAIRDATGEALDFDEGSIYPILHRLERGGLLAAQRTLVGKRSRIGYEITPAGQKRLHESRAAWEAVVRAVTRALQGESDANPTLA